MFRPAQLWQSPHSKVALLLLAAALVTQAGSTAAPRAISTSDPALPQVVLWAWERPEDLRFLNPQETGVAFLAKTIHLRRDFVEVRQRMQPLRVPPGIALVAVVRIESVPERRPPLDTTQRVRIVRAIAEAARIPGVSTVQLDWDARLSERQLYAELLREVREELPGRTGLSITALASWCLGDSWLDELPIDEAVPMLFQMGRDTANVRLHLAAGREFRAPVCQSSLGLSTDEALPRLPKGRRVYVFHARAWTPDAAHGAIELARRTQ